MKEKYQIGLLSGFLGFALLLQSSKGIALTGSVSNGVQLTGTLNVVPQSGPAAGQNPPSAPMAAELHWREDYEKALAVAHEMRKPIILDFTAPWCGWCHKMDETTMRDAVVQSELSDYIKVKIDYDRNQPLAQKYKVRGLPSYVVLNQFGEFVSITTGYSQANQFHDWLVTYHEQAFAQESNAEQMKLAVEALGEQLLDSDAITRGRGIERMLTIYMDPANEAGRKVAVEQFKRLVDANPAYAVNYLDDDRLAARILFGNLFAGKFGEQFNYDPWDSAAARKAVVDLWVNKLEDRGK